MTQAYASVIFNVFKVFKKREIDVDDVAGAIECYFIHHLQDNFERGDQPTLATLRNTVNKHSSWFNYELLQFVVNECGEVEEKDLLQHYVQGPLKRYQELPIAKMPSKLFDYKGSSETHQIEASFKLPVPVMETTAHDVKDMSNRIKERIGVSSLVLKRFEPETSTLHYGIPNKADMQASSGFQYNEHTKVYNISPDIL